MNLINNFQDDLNIHYSKFEPHLLNFCLRQNFAIGNFVKYLFRYPYKGQCKSDLKKALFYFRTGLKLKKDDDIYLNEVCIFSDCSEIASIDLNELLRKTNENLNNFQMEILDLFVKLLIASEKSNIQFTREILSLLEAQIKNVKNER